MSDFAVIVTREEGLWDVAMLPESFGDNLDQLITALRQTPASEVGVLGLVNVSDEFFVAARVARGDVSLLLSDATAAVAWDLAAAVLDRLGIDRPGDDDLDDVLPAGDLSIFADLGIDEMELGMLLDDEEAYADETLAVIAGRLGFADVYERVVEPVPH